MKTLLAIAHDVVDPEQSDGGLISTDIRPYSLYKNKLGFQVSLSYYKLEIKWRLRYNNQDPSFKFKDYPCPMQWRTKKK